MAFISDYKDDSLPKDIGQLSSVFELTDEQMQGPSVWFWHGNGYKGVEFPYSLNKEVCTKELLMLWASKVNKEI